MKVNRSIIFILFISFVILGSADFLFAGNADSYKITLQQIQLKKSDGTWVTISSPNKEVDIAAVGQNQVASALSDVNIPVGEYVNFKCVVSETAKFSGTDGGFYTLTGGDITLTGTAANAASTDSWTTYPPNNVTLTENIATDTAVAASQGEVTAHLGLGAAKVGGDTDDYMEIYCKTDLTTPISVKSDSVISMFFDFDTQNTVHHINMGPGVDIMYFTPPSAGTQFGITVDGVTTTVTEASMKVDF